MSTYEEQRQQAEKLEEAVDVIRKSDQALYRNYKVIKDDEADPLKHYEGFKQEADSVVREIKALEGAVYTDEGKNNLIRERLQELATKYKASHQEHNRVLQIKLDELRDGVESKINANTYESAEETRLKLQDLEAEVRSKLAFVTHQRDVEGIMRELVERGEKDRDAARFASKYAYIFAEKASDIADPSDRHASLRHLKTLADKAEKLSYTEKQRAAITLKETMKHKNFFGGADGRLIDMHLKTMLKKHS